MKKKKISIKYTRDNLADVINDVAYGGAQYQITRFGKVIAELVPKQKTIEKTNFNFIEEQKKLRGIFSEQYPGKTSIEIAKTIRENSYRYQNGKATN